MIYLVLFLLISVSANGLLIWYSIRATKQLLLVSENVSELHQRLEEFDGHIKFVYELEMFYGDETLKNLIRHSKDLLKFMKQYRGVEELTQEPTESIEENDEPTENEEEISQSAVQISSRGKTVFYSGT